MEEELEIPDYDSLILDAANTVIEFGQGSASLLQRKLRLGYNRAGRIIEQLEELGVIGEYKTSIPRHVMTTKKIGSENELFEFKKNFIRNEAAYSAGLDFQTLLTSNSTIRTNFEEYILKRVYVGINNFYKGDLSNEFVPIENYRLAIAYMLENEENFFSQYAAKNKFSILCPSDFNFEVHSTYWMFCLCEFIFFDVGIKEFIEQIISRLADDEIIHPLINVVGKESEDFYSTDELLYNEYLPEESNLNLVELIEAYLTEAKRYEHNRWGGAWLSVLQRISFVMKSAISHIESKELQEQLKVLHVKCSLIQEEVIKHERENNLKWQNEDVLAKDKRRERARVKAQKKHQLEIHYQFGQLLKHGTGNYNRSGWTLNETDRVNKAIEIWNDEMVNEEDWIDDSFCGKQEIEKMLDEYIAKRDHILESNKRQNEAEQTKSIIYNWQCASCGTVVRQNEQPRCQKCNGFFQQM